MGLKKKDDDCARSLSNTLRVLNRLVEYSIRDLPSTVEIVHLFPVSSAYLDSLRPACSFLSLHVLIFVQPPAGVLAFRAQGIGREYTTTVDEARK